MRDIINEEAGYDDMLAEERLARQVEALEAKLAMAVKWLEVVRVKCPDMTMRQRTDELLKALEAIDGK